MEEKIKSKNKKQILKILLFVILIVFIIFLTLTLRKFIIFEKIENVAEDKMNITNYYTEKTSLNGRTLTILKSYVKDNKYLTEIKTVSAIISGKRQLTVYKNNDEKIGIIEADDKKIAFVDGNIIGGETRIYAFETQAMSLLQKLILSVTSRITIEEYNNKECYLIEPAKTWKLWIDKETGLVVREINSSTVTESYYEFNVVKEEDIIKPDISDCEIR